MTSTKRTEVVVHCNIADFLSLCLVTLFGVYLTLTFNDCSTSVQWIRDSLEGGA